MECLLNSWLSLKITAVKRIFYIIGLAIVCLSCQNSNKDKQSTSEDEVIESLNDETGFLIGDLESLTPVIIETPNFDGNVLPSESNHTLTLKLESENKDFTSNDPQDWVTDNQLSMPLYTYYQEIGNFANGLPANVPQKYKDYIITHGFKYDEGDIFLYGENIVDIRFLIITNKLNTKIKHFLDFENFYYTREIFEDHHDTYTSQRIRWAIIEDNVLYVSHSYHGSGTVFEKNAYISAIDLVSYKIIWTTQPLTCIQTFILIDNSIVCGYGLYMEESYLYVLDKHTGERKQAIELDKGPSYIVQKENKIFVRAHAIEYVFQIE